jgi:hypothetical protein
MPGTKRNPIRRPAVQPVSPRALELYAELRRAMRARQRATDCTLSKHGHCTAECRACEAWWDAHAELCSELRLPPWRWPCIGRNPHPPNSTAARKWRPGSAQKELQEQLETARRAAIN